MLIGDAIGLVLPKEVLEKLERGKGDTLFLTEVAAVAATHAVSVLKHQPFAVGNAQAAFLAMGLFLYVNLYLKIFYVIAYPRQQHLHHYRGQGNDQ